MQWLLKLYPRSWRERYEDEMLALLEEHQASPATALDLLMGALDANFNYNGLTEGVSGMLERMRSGLVMVFCAFMLFGTGWLLLQRIPDPAPQFHQAAAQFPAFGVLYHALVIVGCLAFLAFVAGGLPLLIISVKRAAANKQKDVLRFFSLATVCLAIFGLATGALMLWHPTRHIVPFLIGYLILSGLLFIIGTVAVSLMLTNSDFHYKELKFVIIPEIVILFGMAASVILSVIFIILIIAHAPHLFATQDVGSDMFVTGIVMMALGTIFAAMGFRRGTAGGTVTLIQD